MKWARCTASAFRKPYNMDLAQNPMFMDYLHFLHCPVANQLQKRCRNVSCWG